MSHTKNHLSVSKISEELAVSLEPNLPNSVIENTPHLFKKRTPLVTSRLWRAGRFLLLRILRTGSHTSILTSLRPHSPSFQSPTLTSIIWSWLIGGREPWVISMRLLAIFPSTSGMTQAGSGSHEGPQSLPDQLPRCEREGGNPALRLISWSTLKLISWSAFKLSSWSAFKLSSWSTFKLLSCSVRHPLTLQGLQLQWKATTAKNDDKKERYRLTCLDVSATLLHGGLDSTRQVTKWLDL